MTYQSSPNAGCCSEPVNVTEGEGNGIDRRAAHEPTYFGGTIAIAWRKRDEPAKGRDEAGETGGKKSCRLGHIRSEFQAQVVVLAVLKTHGAIRALLKNTKRQFTAQLNDMASKGCQAVAKSRLTEDLHFLRECYKQRLEARSWLIGDVCRRMSTMKHTEAAPRTAASFIESPDCKWMYSRICVCVAAPVLRARAHGVAVEHPVGDID